MSDFMKILPAGAEL